MQPAKPFRLIFRTHVSRVWRTLRFVGIPEADLPDVSQEVFITVFRRYEQYDSDRGSFAAWLSGICIRTAANHRRKLARRREQAEVEAHIGPAQPDELRRRELREALGHALLQLDDKKRDVFVLCEIEQLTMKEVAVAVDCPLQTAYARLYSARRKLAETLRMTLGDDHAA